MTDEILREAADRIEELRAELETLRGERMVGTVYKEWGVWKFSEGGYCLSFEVPAILILQPEEAPE